MSIRNLFTLICFALAVSLIALATFGCHRSAHDIGGETTVQIESTPHSRETKTIPADPNGTKVEIGGGEGVRVDAPGTDVTIGGGEGIKIDTPNTHIDLGGNE